MDNLTQLKKPIERMTSINNVRPNKLTRISVAFGKKFIHINRKRYERNLRPLSIPKITELIIRHKFWYKIEEDIINFLLDEKE